MSPNIYTVTDITAYLKRLIRNDEMCSSVSVKGELSNVKYHSSGHIYFTLKDNGAALSCIMFAGNRSGLKFRMEDGQQVVCSGRIDVFEQAGKYQLYASSVQLTGSGALYEEYERIKKELGEMGMFDASYKRPIPRFVKKLGVVTSATGAARRDIEQIAKRRNPYIEIMLYPALVQGEGAIDSIVRGIEKIVAYEPDVIIVGRGGGSIEDLWAFNSRQVAQAVFECPIPVISAVGHETDTTIIDLVSDLRAPTPSAAAELAVCDIVAVQEEIRQKKMRLIGRMEEILGKRRLMVDKYRLLLEQRSPAQRTRLHRVHLEQQQKAVECLFVSKLEDERMKIVYSEGRIADLMDKRLKDARSRLSIRAAALEGLSPVKRLSAGYAYVEGPDSRCRKSAAQIKTDDELKVTFADGHVLAKVRSVDLGNAPGREPGGMLC